jgi:hypothetical protein
VNGYFKSLSTSSSPDRYVAIIDEVDTRGDIVIVIISPSKIGNGYSFIITAYGHDKFNNFVKNTANEGRILYVKDRGAQVWGRLQLPPQHT